MTRTRVAEALHPFPNDQRYFAESLGVIVRETPPAGSRQLFIGKLGLVTKW